MTSEPPVIEYETSELSLQRYHALLPLFVSTHHSNNIKMVINSNGDSKMIAAKNFAARSEILRIPVDFKITCDGLVKDLGICSHWDGWAEVRHCLADFDANMAHDENICDIFTRNLEFVCAIIAGLCFLSSSTENLDSTPTLKILKMYWKALPHAPGNMFNCWDEGDLSVLAYTNFYTKSYQASKNYTRQVFDAILTPFFQKYSDIFGAVEWDMFIKVVYTISSRSFANGSGAMDDSKLLPVIDLANGTNCGQQNSDYEQTGIMFFTSFGSYHTIHAVKDIPEGSEILIEYGSCSNGMFLLSYDFVPLTRETVMRNGCSEVYLSLKRFMFEEWCSPSKDENESEVDLSLLSMDELETRVSSEHQALWRYLHETLNFPEITPCTLDEAVNDLHQQGSELRHIVLYSLMTEKEAKACSLTGRLRLDAPPSPNRIARAFFNLITKNIRIPSNVEFEELLRTVLSDPDCSKRYRQLCSVAVLVSELQVVEKLTDAFIECCHTLRSSDLALLELLRKVETYYKLFVQYGHSLIHNNEAKRCAHCGEKDSSLRCSRCGTLYCSSTCQKEDWKKHKKMCKK